MYSKNLLELLKILECYLCKRQDLNFKDETISCANCGKLWVVKDNTVFKY